MNNAFKSEYRPSIRVHWGLEIIHTIMVSTSFRIRRLKLKNIIDSSSNAFSLQVYYTYFRFYFSFANGWTMSFNLNTRDVLSVTTNMPYCY